jgi:hypothetical protein
MTRSSGIVGTPECHAERHDERRAARLRNTKRFEVLRDRLVDRHVLVPARIGDADGDQPEQLVDLARRGTLRAARVGNERPISDPRHAADAREDLLGVAQVRHDFRVREARDFDDRRLQLGQPVDHRDLGVGIDPTMKTLQAVARPDFGDADAARQ